MQQITAFKTADGKIFETAAEVEEYEFQLSWSGRVEEFMRSSLCPYPSGLHKTMAQKTIIAWEAYKAGMGGLTYQKTTIAEAGFTQRTTNVLLEAGILYAEDAQELSNNALMKFPNLGRKSINEIRQWSKP